MSISVKRMRRTVAKMYRLKDWKDSEILALNMDKYELADFFDITLSTVEYHLRKRKLKVLSKPDVDSEYLIKQILYLYFKQMTAKQTIAAQLQIPVGVVDRIVADAFKHGYRQVAFVDINLEPKLFNYVNGFDSYRDVANVFPKKGGYQLA